MDSKVYEGLCSKCQEMADESGEKPDMEEGMDEEMEDMPEGMDKPGVKISIKPVKDFDEGEDRARDRMKNIEKG